MQLGIYPAHKPVLAPSLDIDWICEQSTGAFRSGHQIDGESESISRSAIPNGNPAPFAILFVIADGKKYVPVLMIQVI